MIPLRYILWTLAHLQSNVHTHQQNPFIYQTGKDEIKNDLPILTTSTGQTDKFWVLEDYTIYV